MFGSHCEWLAGLRIGWPTYRLAHWPTGPLTRKPTDPWQVYEARHLKKAGHLKKARPGRRLSFLVDLDVYNRRKALHCVV